MLICDTEGVGYPTGDRATFADTGVDSWVFKSMSWGECAITGFSSTVVVGTDALRFLGR